MFKSSPVILRRTGAQVQVPLCHQQQHQPQLQTSQKSQVYDEDQIKQKRDISLDEEKAGHLFLQKLEIRMKKKTFILL